MEGVTVRKSLETICCICWRRKGKKGWRKATVGPLARLSHGYCPECYRQTMLGYGLAPVSERLLERESREVLG